MSESFDLPVAPIQRIIKQALPSSANVSKEVKLAFGKAAALFVLYLTHTANDVCRSSHRSMVNADDVLAAVEEIEFDMFLPPLQEYLKEFRVEAQKRKRPRSGVAAVDGDGASPAAPSGKKRGRPPGTKVGVTAAAAAAARNAMETAAAADAAEEPESKKTRVDGVESAVGEPAAANDDEQAHSEDGDEDNEFDEDEHDE